LGMVLQVHCADHKRTVPADPPLDLGREDSLGGRDNNGEVGFRCLHSSVEQKD
jgi:hypothetical protein